MKRTVVSGIRSPRFARGNSNGFVNRRSGFRSPAPAPDSENPVVVEKTRGSASMEAGFAAAVAAGRKPVDFHQFGAVDRAVLAEIGRYQAIPRKTKADRQRLRAALIPFIQGAS